MTTPTPFHPSPGQEVLGYRLVRLLGKGGFGEVWLATGPGGFEVAVKFVQRQTGAEKAERRSLQILRVVKHRCLLGVFAADEVGNYLVIVMELARASLLDRWHQCRQQGQAGIPRGELLRAMAHAAEGLDYLNAPRHTIDGKQNVGIQHRDIKPHNLLLVGDDVKVADFGLARLQQDSSASHSGSMTLAYAPPEFFQNKTTTRSDQFSLAATYVQMRTGRLPFGDKMQEILARHLHSQEGPDLRGLAEGEGEVVAKALARNPEDRYPGCKHFVLALKNAMQGKEPGPVTGSGGPSTAPTVTAKQSVAPTPTAVTEPLPRRRRGNRAVLTFGILAALVVLGGGAVAVGLWARPKGRTSPTGAEVPSRPGFLGKLQHTQTVWGTAWSPDGTRILTAATDKTARIWDAATGKELHTLVGHTNGVTCVAWNRDGTRCATAGLDGSVRVWDTDISKELQSLKAPSELVYSVAYSPDDTLLAAGCEGGVAVVWDAATGKERFSLRGHTDIVWSVAFSPDGKLIVTGSADRTAKLWDAATGKEIRTLSGHTDQVQAVAFRSDGKQIVSGGRDNLARLWDTATGKEIRSFPGHTDFVYGVAWRPDGKRIATCSRDTTAKVWDAETGKEVLTLQGDDSLAWSVAWSPDGKRIVTGRWNATARVWDAETGE